MNVRINHYLIILFFMVSNLFVSSEAGFLSQFLESTKMVGAVSPSSRFLRDKMLDNINFEKDLVIVEYGPGTGVFTHKIVEKMSKGSVLYLFELNDEFYNKLSAEISDPRVKIFHESAETVKEYLLKDDIHHVDYVVSGLPLAVIPKQVKKNILEASKGLLSDDGLYVQFQYSLNDKSLLKDYFSTVKIGFTLFNLPPAFVYSCSNK